MGWSLMKSAGRVAIPAATMCVLSIARDLWRTRPPKVSDVLIGNIGVFLLMWLGVTLLMWAATNAWARFRRTGS